LEGSPSPEPPPQAANAVTQTSKATCATAGTREEERTLFFMMVDLGYVLIGDGLAAAFKAPG
jgi:hypothetical protein